jgi:hypothetical protein
VHHQHIYSLGDEDSVYFQNVGIYGRVYTAPNAEEDREHILTAVKHSNLTEAQMLALLRRILT